MSRNFEEAYRAEVQLNIPDLWNRIESALPEKQVVPDNGSGEAVTVAADVVSFERAEKAAETNFNHRSNVNKKKKAYAWMKWAPLVAAAMFMLILIPGIVGVGLIGLTGGLASDMAAAESAPAVENMQDAMPEAEAMESPAMNSDMKLEDSVASQETIENQMSVDATLESMEESVMEELQGEAERYEEVSGVMLVGQIPVEVMLVGESVNEEYCELWLTIPEAYYAEFQGRQDFECELLKVRFYYTEGTEPEIGDVFNANIYEADSGEYLWVRMAP